MSKIRVALIGVGNCASSLVQGVSYYGKAKNEDGDWKKGENYIKERKTYKQ